MELFVRLNDTARHIMSVVRSNVMHEGLRFGSLSSEKVGDAWSGTHRMQR